VSEILGILGILFLTFVIIPWGVMITIDLLKDMWLSFWKENNRFD